MADVLYVVLALAVLAALSVLIARLAAQSTAQKGMPAELGRLLEEKHRAMLTDLHGGLAQQSDRLSTRLSEELNQTRETLHRLQLSLSAALGETTDKLNARIDQRLEQISGKVSERLDEGFKKTNETFVNVMQRLATIDEAQKKIEGLTTNVVSLQQLLGDKRSRGALGEMQLEQIVRNQLPETSFEFQYTFARGGRADCVLKLPEPVGLIAVDSKFPLENYERMLADGPERASPAMFKADVRRHIDDIASKYIIPGETTDGAVMFIPAEAVFAEIHAKHRDLVEHAQARRVWITSPTTLMAVLNTVRAVLRDVETRKQVHIIKDELGKLGREFNRFDDRMKRLADHIRQAHDDVTQVHITSRKITERFASIERVDFEQAESLPAPGLELPEGRKDSA
jgi:DNA recombination protein RmuC